MEKREGARGFWEQPCVTPPLKSVLLHISQSLQPLLWGRGVHLCTTPPKSTPDRDRISSPPSRPPASRLDLSEFTCATGDHPQFLKVADGAVTRYSLLLNSWIPGTALTGGLPCAHAHRELLGNRDNVLVTLKRVMTNGRFL